MVFPTLAPLTAVLVNHTTFQISMGTQQNNMVDVTAQLPPLQLISLHYSDPISFEADTLDLTFSDVKDQIINNSKVKKGIWMQVVIHQYNKDYQFSHVKRDIGSFMIDQIKQSGPPTQTTLMGSSVPIDQQIKMTLQNRTIFTTSLAGLAQRVASENNMGIDVSDAGVRANQPISQAEQWNESDLQMLSRMCKSKGLAMKITTVNGKNTIVIFDEQVYEQRPSVYTIDFSLPGAGIGMTHWELTTQSQDIYSTTQLMVYDHDTNTLIVGQSKDPGKIDDFGEDDPDAVDTGATSSSGGPTNTAPNSEGGGSGSGTGSDLDPTDMSIPIDKLNMPKTSSSIPSGSGEILKLYDYPYYTRATSGEELFSDT
jgi:hypothetical protein